MTSTRRISQLVQKGIETGLINQQDTVYVRNQLMGILQLEDFQSKNEESSDLSIPSLVDELVRDAVSREVIDDLLDEKEILAAKLMDCFVPLPSQVTNTFWSYYQDGAEQATNYFYNLSQNSNYIQTKRIAKNIQFTSTSSYGELDITINLSKPEKDPEQLKRERAKKDTPSYPKCLLCPDNEGYQGRIGYPARSNHRIIPMELTGEKWFLQYSPYVYYNEHSILLAESHRPMAINKGTFDRLIQFVELFPHYFIGSNADLPIVGGSILNHDHYQAGKYQFAMERSEMIDRFTLASYPSVEATMQKWPLSVIRLRSADRNEIVEASSYILEKWRHYSDQEAEILAESDGEQHNTITPIARRRGEQFEMDVTLRNNRTSEEHPYGIFHPHEDVHHIKKENIGLIEVMGLAVLPPRLETELKEIKKYLLNQPAEVADYHMTWANQLKEIHPSVSEQEAEAILKQETGNKFARVLEDAGVFKQSEEGLAAFRRFINQL